MQAFTSLLFFIIAIGILVTFHEYGHYLVARKLGVKVLRFSVGFGKPLLSWRRVVDGDEIEYVIAAIPLGGYVKMLDEREAMVAETDKPKAFNNKPVSTRIAVVIAGPLFNFMLAMVLYWIVFVYGVTAVKPVLGDPEPDSLASAAGFMNGEIVRRVGETEVVSWQAFRLAIIEQGLDGGELLVTVTDETQSDIARILDLRGTHLLEEEGDAIGKLGFRQWWPDLPAEIGGVIEDGAAEEAGIMEGDIIRRVGDQQITSWEQVVEIVRANPGSLLDMNIERGGEAIQLQVMPGTREIEGAQTGYIGAWQHVPESLKEDLTVEISYGPVESIWLAIEKTWDSSLLTLKVFWKILTGEASLKNISGPVTIAQYAGLTASIGFATYIGFLAIISVSLGVLNLLPVPILDGGHLMYYLIEIIKGSPVSEAFEARGQVVGGALLGTLMFVAIFNDLQRLMQ